MPKKPLTLPDSSDFAIAAEITLTPEGPARGLVLHVRQGRIESVMPEGQFARLHPDVRPLGLEGHALIPGMVDTHTHTGQAFGKSLICGEPMQIWRRIWVPLEDALDEQRSYISAKQMFLEALRGGFTTIVNFNRNSPQNNEAVHRAAADTGIRLVSGVAASTDSPSARHVIDQAREHMAACARHPNVHPSLCFGFYGENLEGLDLSALSEVGRFCVDQRLLFQMHSNEHFPDVHDCIVRFGKRPIELWDSLGILHDRTLLHHATLVSAEEVALLQEANAAVSYNPVASHWKGNAVAPALEYARRGIRMGLGTDATRMDAFRTMDAAESTQRVVRGMPVLDFSCGAGFTWLDAASRGGADACGLKEVTGAIEPGLAADFLLVDLRVPEMVPSWDVEWELVRYCNRDQVRAVAVAGRFVMADGEPLHWDMEAFLKEADTLAREMVGAAGVVRIHGTATSHRTAA
jgi:cytosine/adenosine deaminase-related metal-dependent hydrolase